MCLSRVTNTHWPAKELTGIGYSVRRLTAGKKSLTYQGRLYVRPGVVRAHKIGDTQVAKGHRKTPIYTSYRPGLHIFRRKKDAVLYARAITRSVSLVRVIRVQWSGLLATGIQIMPGSGYLIKEISSRAVVVTSMKYLADVTDSRLG